jgi:hypothetical protein
MHLNNVKVIEVIAIVNLVDYLAHKHVNLFSIDLLHIRQVCSKFLNLKRPKTSSNL